MKWVSQMRASVALVAGLAAGSACKSKPAQDAPGARLTRVEPDATALLARARANETPDTVPVPRAPDRLLEAADSGPLGAGGSHLSAQAIERVRALESYKRLAEIPSAVDRLAHAKAWDKALEVIRSVDGLGKRVKDESAEIVTRAGPEALDFMTKLATFVIDARTELSMVEVDRTAEQREKSVKRFVEIGKAVFR